MCGVKFNHTVIMSRKRSLSCLVLVLVVRCCVSKASSVEPSSARISPSPAIPFNPAILNYRRPNVTELVFNNFDVISGTVAGQNSCSSNNNSADSPSVNCKPPTSNEEADLNMSPMEMIRFRGYLAEEHQVVTRDCYVLTMFRIRNPVFAHLEQRPVLLGHGILGNSVNFLFNSIGGSVQDADNHNLAFALARRGYDVWLGNFRGSVYSKKHVKWNADKGKHLKPVNHVIDRLIDFDWPLLHARQKNSIGTFPLMNTRSWTFRHSSATFNGKPTKASRTPVETLFCCLFNPLPVLISRSTGEMGYVGFSQGTLVMFYLQSMHPHLSEIVRPFVAIAPISRLHHTRHPIRSLASNPLLKRLFRSLGELNLRSRLTHLAVDVICHSGRQLLPFICGNMMKITIGHHGRLNFTRLPVYLKNFPDSTSAQVNMWWCVSAEIQVN